MNFHQKVTGRLLAKLAVAVVGAAVSATIWPGYGGLVFLPLLVWALR